MFNIFNKTKNGLDKNDPYTSILEAETILQQLASVFFLSTSNNLDWDNKNLQNLLPIRFSSEPVNIKARYNTLLEQIPAVVFMASLDKGVGEAYVSPHIEKILGFKQSEWINDPLRWYKQLHPEDKTRWSTEAAEMFLMGKPLKSIYRVIARAGHTVWFQCEAKMVRSEDGRPQFIHGVGFDITELKTTEEALRKIQDELESRVKQRTAELAETNNNLRQSEEMYRELYENANDLIYTQDLENNITSVNKAVERLTKYSFEEICKLKIDDIVFKEDLEQTQKLFSQIINEKLPATYEIRIIDKSGNLVPIEASSRLVIKDSKAIAIQTIARDITERKQAEIMKVSHKAALESVRIKSEFLANMSHEIRTPLNGVIGMVHILLNSNLSEEQRKFTTIIRNSSDMLLQIVNDILDLSKIEAEKVTIERIPLNLYDIVSDIVSTFSEQVTSKGLHLFSYIFKEVPDYLLGDPVRVRQVLINLVSNAIKFTSKGEIVIRVKVENKDNSPDSLTVRFEVLDSGIGVSQEDGEKLFNPFVQAETSIARKYGGTGLGLAICKKLVLMMGGEIGVTGQRGIGSNFYFTVHFTKPEEANKTCKPLLIIENQRVLVINDNKIGREILQLQFNDWQISGDFVESGKEALTALHNAAKNNNPFNVLILTVDLLDISPIELARNIKLSAEILNTKLVMFTPFNFPRNAYEEQLSAIFICLNKPVSQSQLFNCLRRITSDTDEVSFNIPKTNPLEDSEIEKLATGKLILLVDDNETNQSVAELMLTSFGCSVDLALSGFIALDKILSNSYDLIFMDCQMPGMDGYETTIKIREIEKKDNKHTPIIALTAGAMQGDRELCFKAGMDDYLTKPVLPKDFKRTINKWLAKDTSTDMPRYKAIALKISGDINKSSILVNNRQTNFSDLYGESIDQSTFASFRFLQKERGVDILSKIFEPFFSSFPNSINLMRKAVDEENYQDLKQLAHKTKGSSVAVSAKKISSLCSEIEKIAVLKSSDLLKTLLENVENEFSIFRKSIYQVLKDKHND